MHTPLIPCRSCKRSKSFGTRPLGQAPCRGFEGVLSEYRKALQRGIVLSGPTSFAPVIRKAVDLVKASGNELHVLLIIADGQVSEALEALSVAHEAVSHMCVEEPYVFCGMTSERPLMSAVVSAVLVLIALLAGSAGYSLA